MSTFVAIKHYVKNSYGHKPAYIIEMSDGEYICNGCVWTLNTLENRTTLIEAHDCACEIHELLKAPGIHTDALIDGRYMFYGCTTLEEWSTPLPMLLDGAYMFHSSNISS